MALTARSPSSQTSGFEMPLRPSCTQCNKSFSSQKDLNRHRSSIHDKRIRYWCPEESCPRARRGFTRKDHCDRHVRSHGISRDNLAQASTSEQMVGSQRESKLSNDLEGLSKKELAGLVEQERAKRFAEEAKRRNLKKELQELRRQL